MSSHTNIPKDTWLPTCTFLSDHTLAAWCLQQNKLCLLTTCFNKPWLSTSVTLCTCFGRYLFQIPARLPPFLRFLPRFPQFLKTAEISTMTAYNWLLTDCLIYRFFNDASVTTQVHITELYVDCGRWIGKDVEKWSHFKKLFEYLHTEQE